MCVGEGNSMTRTTIWRETRKRTLEKEGGWEVVKEAAVVYDVDQRLLIHAHVPA